MKTLRLFTCSIFLTFCAPVVLAQAIHKSPSASELLTSFSKEAVTLKQALFAVANNSADPLYPDLVAGTIRFKITKNITSSSRGIKIVLAPASDATATPVDTTGPNKLGTYVPRVATLTYPYPTPASSQDKTLEDWLASPAVKDLVGRPATTADGACMMVSSAAETNDVVTDLFGYCDAELATTNKDFWFEVLPVHLQCHIVSKPNLYSYRNSLRMSGTCPSQNVVVSETDWKRLRAEIMGEVLTGAILWQAEKVVDGDNTYLQNKTRCFQVSQPFNEKVMASMSVPFKMATAVDMKMSDMGMMAMPEANYALGAANAYYTDKKKALFNNTNHAMINQVAGSTVPDQFPRIRLQSSTATTFIYHEGGSLFFNFNVRGLYGPGSPSGCPVFCDGGKELSPLRQPTHEPSSTPMFLRKEWNNS